MTQTLTTLSQALFAGGVILLVLGFAAHVGHTVLLAAGRRAAVAVRALAPQPALAGVATGSFVKAREAARSNGPDDFAAASPLAGSSILLATAAFAVLLASIALRAYLVGRGPWGTLYEFSVAFATSMLGGYLLLERRFPIRSIGLVPTGAALILALYAASLPSEIEPLVPALQNAPLLTIHVGMAVLSYGIFATSFAAGVGYLIQGRGDRFSWLPSHRVLDAVAYRAVILGFPVFATMIILGSWWASIAWSRYWGWDPKETAALVTWLTYAIYLHARNQRAWAGRPSALLLVIGFLMVLVTYSGSLWFNGLHAYSGL